MISVAHLPMYDLPEVTTATDALWRGIAARLRAAGVAEAPVALSRHLTHQESWRHPGLVFGQSCGYPAVYSYRDMLRIVAAPIYNAPGCSGSTHRSFFIVPADSRARVIADLRGARFALNAWDSNTGMNLARLALAPLASDGRFLGEIIETGGHAASLALVANRGADAAAIDCVSYALFARYRPTLTAATRILAPTAPSPTLPFVTTRATGGATIRALRDALAGAFSDPALAESRAALFLTGITPADEADYGIIRDYEDTARDLGYARLA